MFKRVTEMFSAMKQLHGIGGVANEVAERLNRERVVGKSGAGMVEVEMTGGGSLVRVKIAPELVAKGDHEMLEDLVAAAFRQATEKAQECSTKVLQEVASTLPLGDLSGLLGQLGVESESDDDSEESGSSQSPLV